MTNFTNYSNADGGELAKEAGSQLIKQILLFSGYLVNYILDMFESSGVTLARWQVSGILVLVDVVLIIIVARFIIRWGLKIVILGVLIWVLLGFFVPPN